MDQQNFCLRWDSFQSSLTAMFDKLRLSEELVDITLCCEGQQLSAHRLVLSASSPYFRALLHNHTDQRLMFYMKDTAFSDLKAVVEFMYTGSVNIAQHRLTSFIKTAENLQIRGLSSTDKMSEDSHSVSDTTTPSTPHSVGDTLCSVSSSHSQHSAPLTAGDVSQNGHTVRADAGSHRAHQSRAREVASTVTASVQHYDRDRGAHSHRRRCDTMSAQYYSDTGCSSVDTHHHQQLNSGAAHSLAKSDISAVSASGNISASISATISGTFDGECLAHAKDCMDTSLPPEAGKCVKLEPDVEEISLHVISELSDETPLMSSAQNNDMMAAVVENRNFGNFHNSLQCIGNNLDLLLPHELTSADELMDFRAGAPRYSRTCHVCGKTLHSQATYSQHMDRHAGRTKCHICGRVLSSVQRLKSHLRSGVHGPTASLAPPATASAPPLPLRHSPGPGDCLYTPAEGVVDTLSVVAPSTECLATTCATASSMSTAAATTGSVLSARDAYTYGCRVNGDNTQASIR